MQEIRQVDFFQLESSIWIANLLTHIPAYDFSFEPVFQIRRPRIDVTVETVARIGAIFNYKELYQKCLEFDYKLINSPEQHQLASELEHWYPHISDLTPKSKIYEDFPSLSEFYKIFKFPVFIKGNRQTAKHNPELAIAHSEDDFHRIQKMYQQNNILHWQKIVVRELESLKR